MPDSDKHPLARKKILLGVTGGIAAYKAAELCRLLLGQGAEVRVVMTPAACEFIQPLTFQALTGHRVYTDLFGAEAGAENAMDHIELGRWANLLLVAPATADFMAKLVAGYADNLLLTIALATAAPLAVAPAMNQQMYTSQATRKNIHRLRGRGVHIWGPASGEQACGDIGPGRMLEPAQLTVRVERLMQPGRLEGCRVMLTAGPTREAIDPVRYLSNRSSGKMGYALAEALVAAGAQVTLVSGPVCLEPPVGVSRIVVTSAQDMLEAVEAEIDRQDIFIGCAAVADYRVASVATDKIKKSAESLTLELLRNPDILATVATRDPRPFCVGFAAETRDLEKYARGKLLSKHLDLVAANRVDSGSSGFEVDDNALSVFWKEGSRDLERQPKKLLADALVDIIADLFLTQRT
jgi:phosphopantothenoylcysteine decarboxylase/phosphopantothenate--cysteine ligase